MPWFHTEQILETVPLYAINCCRFLLSTRRRKEYSDPEKVGPRMRIAREFP
jgi:hypothetical protein